MIECRHIDFSYDSKTILQGIDLNIENGEFLCILGQSGCGKSTLLRLPGWNGRRPEKSGSTANRSTGRIAIVPWSFRIIRSFPG